MILICSSLVISNVEYFFIYLLDIYMSSFYSVPCPFLNQIFCYSVARISYIFLILVFYQIYSLWIFSSNLSDTFFFLCCAEKNFFYIIPFVYICFCCLSFWCQIQEIIAKTNVKNLSSSVFFPWISWFHNINSNI